MAILKALIIDDEKLARNHLKAIIEETCPEINIIAMADSADAAREVISTLSPDVIFLDIEMPQENGIDFLNSIKNRKFSVVFVTAYNQYAIKAIKSNAFDYLLKPIDTDELRTAVNNLIVYHTQPNNTLSDTEEKEKLITLLRNISFVKNIQKVTIPYAKGYKVIDTDDIIVLEGNNNYTNIYLKDNPAILSTRTLKDYETNILDHLLFFRAHKSYLINLIHFKEFLYEDGGYIVMSNKMKIPISRGKSNILLERINCPGPSHT